MSGLSLRLINAFLLLLTFVFSIYILISGLADRLGQNIPSSDIALDYSQGILVAMGLLAAVYIVPFSAYSRDAIHFVATMKTLVVLVFSLFYEANYSFLDSYSYFDIGLKEVAFDTSAFAGGSGTEAIYSLTNILLTFLPASFHATKAVFSFFGLCGVIVFSFGICRLLKRKTQIPFLLVGLWPSVLFWTSIVGKDPIVFLGIALMFYALVTIYEFVLDQHPVNLVGVLAGVAGVLICFVIRPWLVYVFVGSGIFALFLKSKIFTKIAILSLAIPVLVATTPMMLDYFGTTGIDSALEVLDSNSRGWSEDGGSGQTQTTDLTNYRGIILFLPIAAPVALFAPLPFQVNNAFGLLAGIENLVLLWLFGTAIIAYRKAAIDYRSSAIFLWLLATIVGWAMLYGPISFQNLGTAVRFKVQILPYMLAFIVLSKSFAKRKEK